MPYDFLNTTTVEPELEQQQALMDMLTQRAIEAQAHRPVEEQNDPRDLQEINDNDLNDLVEMDDEHEEVSDEDAEKLATDTHDFQNEDFDATDYQLMGYLMGEETNSPKMQYGGGTLANAGTVYSGDSANWLRDRVNNIKYQNLNSKISSRYKPEMPQPNQNTIQKNAEDFVKNDPIARNLGIDMMAAGGAYSTDYQYGGRYTLDEARTGIHIKPENRGKFNATKRRTGKTTEELTHSSNPTTRRRAIFAQNARKWHHRQFGGPTLFAEDEATLREGLNNNNYNRAVLKLSGINTIRGLDNHQPVAVTDGSKYQVLHGPHDTAQFKGKVYETRL